MSPTVRIGPAVETNTAMPLQASKTVRVGQATEVDTAMPLRVVQTWTSSWNVDRPPIEVEVRATTPLAPRRLTAQEQTIVALISQVGAMYAADKGASAELTVEIAILLYLLLREFTRRCLPPSD